jgi:hypothetical protein
MEGRLGFHRLVAGNVGLMLGVEMSRLARSCRDWHQLLEICSLFDTLIAHLAESDRYRAAMATISRLVARAERGVSVPPIRHVDTR